jgi:hypothetical protein
MINNILTLTKQTIWNDNSLIIQTPHSQHNSKLQSANNKDITCLDTQKHDN